MAFKRAASLHLPGSGISRIIKIKVEEIRVTGNLGDNVGFKIVYLGQSLLCAIFSIEFLTTFDIFGEYVSLSPSQ